jgi:hypothetical protein
MAGLDQLLALISGAQDTASGNDAEVQSQIIAKANLGESSAALMDAMNAKNQDVSRQLLQGQLESQDASHNIAVAFGGAQDDPTNMLPMLGQAFRENTAKVMELDSQSFFDNPLAWLPNQFKADAAERAANDAARTMQTINSTISSGAAAQKAIARIVTKDSMAAALEVQSMQSQIDANKLRSDNADQFINGITALEGRNTKQIELAKDAMSAINSEESLTMQREHLALARQGHALNSKLQDEQLKAARLMNQDRESAQAGAATEVDLVNLGSSKSGAPLNLPAGKDGIPALSQLAKGTGGQRAISAAMRIGAAAVAHPTYGAVIYGDTASLALSTAIDIGAKQPTNPEEQKVKSFILDTLAELKTPGMHGTAAIAKGDSPQNQAAILDDTVIKKLAAMDNNVEMRGSIRAAPKLGTLASVGSIAATPLYSKVLALQVAAGNGDSSIESILKHGMEAVRLKQITPNELLDGITAIYSGTIDYNNIHGNVKGWGVPMQDSYKTIVDYSILPFTSDREPIDWSKREQVARAVVGLQLKSHFHAANPVNTFLEAEKFTRGAIKQGATFAAKGIFGE